MEPIPETRDAMEQLERIGSGATRQVLDRLTALARERVPGLVGVSLSLLDEGLVMTYVATDVDTASLDAAQYADDGPCLEAVRSDSVVHCETQSLLDEGLWQLFARAGAAAGVASSLSLPLRGGDGRVTGGVNAYGARADTFDGHVEELAALFGAWAPGAVANADLSFSTRHEAMKAPRRLQEQAKLDRAAGILAHLHGVDLDTAGEKLHRAAARAGVSPLEFATALVHTFEARP